MNIESGGDASNRSYSIEPKKVGSLPAQIPAQKAVESHSGLEKTAGKIKERIKPPLPSVPRPLSGPKGQVIKELREKSHLRSPPSPPPIPPRPSFQVKSADSALAPEILGIYSSAQESLSPSPSSDKDSISAEPPRPSDSGEGLEILTHLEDSRALHADKRGSVIKATFKRSDGEEIAEECAVRENSVLNLLNQLNSKKKVLKNNLYKISDQIKIIDDKPPPLNKSDLKQLDGLKSKESSLKKRIEDADLHIKECQKQIKRGKSWGSTDTPRHLFKNLPKEEARLNNLSTLNNQRMQTVRDSEGNLISAVGRSAAITDFAHGEVSLQELSDYENLLKMKDKEKLSPEERKRLTFLYQLSPKTKRGKQISTEKQVHKLLKNLKKNIIESYGVEILKEDNNPSALQEVIRGRQDNLEAMFLQDLHSHLKTQSKITTIDGVDHLVFGRTALLDPTKASKNEHGFINNEKTQTLDMMSIYDRLDGAVIRFDMEDAPDAGPYIDIEGNIHMPKALKPQGNRDVIMSTVFMNVSAQGHVCNDGLQKFINDEAIKKLQSLAAIGLVNAAKFKKLNDSLIELSDPNKDNDPFKTSHLAVQLMQDCGYASVDCYGGKDRTGYLLALVTHDSLASLLEKVGGEWEKDLTRFDMELLKDNGVAAEIVKDNTGQTFLKLLRKDLELYHLETDSGKSMRKDHFIGAAKVWAYAKMHIKPNVESIASHITYDDIEPRKLKAVRL